MSANKKQRQPPEDLAAAVADMINSPITRSNLSFLRPLPELEVRSELYKEPTVRPTESQPSPAGVVSRPPGLVPCEPGQLDDTILNEIGPPITSKEYAPANDEIPIKSWQPIKRPQTLWQAEILGTLFEQTRVRRIQQAQDALSLVEEKVYDLLWGPKNQRKDDFRLVHYSLQRLSVDARINIKTVRELIPRLIDKGFVSIEQEADVRRNIATLYRVSSYSTILKDQKRRNRVYVSKTGKGVFYVHPITASIEDAPRPTGYAQEPMPFTPTALSAAPLGHSSCPGGSQPSGPMGLNDLKPMGYSGTASIDIPLDNLQRQTTSTTYTALFELIKQTLGLEPDEALLQGMILACNQNAFFTTQTIATDDELLYFTKAKAQVLSRATNIRNHLAVLRKAVPECFLGETFRAYRATLASQKQRIIKAEELSRNERLRINNEIEELENRHALWTMISERYKSEKGYDMQAIFSDSQLDSAGRQQAHGMLHRLGRFTKLGLWST